jgi:NADPH:quinone reductase-like Zn-dependent oxidoreductase
LIDRTFPLEDAAAAIRYVETEHPRGKVVLTIG